MHGLVIFVSASDECTVPFQARGSMHRTMDYNLHYVYNIK